MSLFYLKRTWMMILVGCLCGLALHPTAAFAQNDACDPKTTDLQTGQAFIEAGAYSEAVTVFACVIAANPLDITAYRGKIEANLLAGKYSDAVHGYTEINIHVIPEVPDAVTQIIAYYQETLPTDPNNVILLTGYSFALWWVSDYPAALKELDQLLKLEPDNLYALTFHGSSSFFAGNTEIGERNFERALELAPESADLYFILADGYTYALGDFERALEAVTTAHDLGLDTARVNAIFGTAYFYLGEEAQAIPYFANHIERATVEAVKGETLKRGESVVLDFKPGQTYHLTVEAGIGETLRIAATSAVDKVDTIMVLLAEDGTLITGNDDSVELNAGFTYEIDNAGTYTLLVSSFEAAGSGEVTVTRE